LISTDCGISYNEVYFKGGTTLATAPAFTSMYVPTSTEWRTENIDLSNFTGHQKVIVTFRNMGNWGNALYIDNVNISNDLHSNVIADLKFGVYPNPILAGEILHFEHVDQLKRVELINQEGKLKAQYFDIENNQIVLPNNLASGIYTVRMESATLINHAQIIVK
jgi:hypothetical protein